jgi:hypothetical protein
MTAAGPYSGVTTEHARMENALNAGDGIVRFAPIWVPRAFCTPGQRIRLHPDDYYPLGKDRGGIDERWLASPIRAENGPLTDPFEGLSLVVDPEGGVIPFDEFIEYWKGELVGKHWELSGGWPMYSKFFDNQAPLPFHIHHRDEHAALVNKPGKPEAYYFPPQMNNHMGDFPYTFFGLHPETSKDQVLDKLIAFTQGGDNRITELSKAYRITPGTGWDVPAGILHAPASVCTYEPQAACDVFAMAESWSNNREVPDELLWKDVPEEKHGDFDFIIELIDWDRNVDSHLYSHRFTPPVETLHSRSLGDDTVTEKWITYRSPSFSAKELTVRPGGSVVIPDNDAHGLIAVSGMGTLNNHHLESVTLLRYGQLSSDEYFVSEKAARAGVRVANMSLTEDLVLLKHFGPANEQLAAEHTELGLLG